MRRSFRVKLHRLLIGAGRLRRLVQLDQRIAAQLVKIGIARHFLDQRIGLGERRLGRAVEKRRQRHAIARADALGILAEQPGNDIAADRVNGNFCPRHIMADLQSCGVRLAEIRAFLRQRLKIRNPLLRQRMADSIRIDPRAGQRQRVGEALKRAQQSGGRLLRAGRDIRSQSGPPSFPRRAGS